MFGARSRVYPHPAKNFNFHSIVATPSRSGTDLLGPGGYTLNFCLPIVSNIKTVSWSVNLGLCA